jgi:hypothetical protein
VIIHGECAIEQGGDEQSIGNRKGWNLTWLSQKRGARERRLFAKTTLINIAIRSYSHVSRPSVKDPRKPLSEK